MNSQDEQGMCRALAAAVEALKKIEGTDGSGYLVDFEMRQVAAGALAIVRKLAPAGMA